MSSEPRPLNVLVISPEASLLHEISWILQAVGYRVETAGDLAADALWRRYATADFVIVDGRQVAEPTGEIFSCDADNPLYRIFLYDPSRSTDFAAWFAAGAHDGLRTPVSRGELLARLRAGARYLEFERRLAVQSTRSGVPGMYSRRGLLRKMRKQVENDEAGENNPTTHTLLVTSVDWYAGIRRKCGESAARNLVNTTARALKRAVGENGTAAYLGEGRFATLVAGQSAASAKCMAEGLAKDFASRESHHESIPRPTLTSAVVPWMAGSDVDRFLAEALETLELAEQSGGDVVIVHGDFNRQYTAWKEEMTSGNPFASVVAQDIMEPFAAEQVEESHFAGSETIAHDASFPEIYEAFSSRGCGTLVVTCSERRLGYITCEGFLSMIDPIDTETFAGSDKSVEELKYLVVPSVAGAGSVEPVGV